MGMFSRREESVGGSSDNALTGYQKPKPTGLRLLTSCMYLLSVIFLVLVEIGSINGKAVIKDTYFVKIGLANVVPQSVPNAVFINSIARSIGLHDFYQVGVSLPRIVRLSLCGYIQSIGEFCSLHEVCQTVCADLYSLAMEFL